MVEDISFLVIQMQKELQEIKGLIAGQLNDGRILKIKENIAVMRDILDDMDDCL